MYYRGYITYKGRESRYFDAMCSLIMTTPPQITHSEIKHDTFVIPGRHGELYGKDTYRGNATIRVSFALVSNDIYRSSYQEALNSILYWLSGTGTLIISDEPDAYYEVKKVIIATDTRKIVRFGTLDIDFIVYPYKFFTTGDSEQTGSTIYNGHDECMPTYTISGSGSGTLEVNGNQMTFNSTGSLIINTRNKMAHTSAGANRSSAINGDYDKLHLISGNNTVSVTSGFTVKTVPKWGLFI